MTLRKKIAGLKRRICLVFCVLLLNSSGDELFARSPFTPAEKNVKIAVLGIEFSQISSQDSATIYDALLDSLAGKPEILLVAPSDLSEQYLELGGDDLLQVANALSADYLLTGKFENIAGFVRIQFQVSSILTNETRELEDGCVMDPDIISHERIPSILAQVYSFIEWPTAEPGPNHRKKLWFVAGGLAAASAVALLLDHDNGNSQKALPRPPSF
jgi:hypothetical protein